MRSPQQLLIPREYAVEPPDGDKGREERGAHYTPRVLAMAMCRSLKAATGIEPKTILEPGCGGGAFLFAADATWPKASLLGVDLLPACIGPGVVVERDLFDVEGPFDLIVGNPDFTHAESIVRHCFAQLAPGGLLALLLLSDFEGSKGRLPFWSGQPLYMRQAIGGARPSFREDGQTDMRPYAMHVWKEGHRGNYIGLPPLDWEEVGRG
jgi:SAM-dependent methyltransferase